MKRLSWLMAVVMVLTGLFLSCQSDDPGSPDDDSSIGGTQIAEGVHVITEAQWTDGSVTLSGDSSTVTLTGDLAQQVKAGDVLVGEQGRGFLKKVGAVTALENGIEASLSHAALADLFVSATVSLDSALAAAEPQPAALNGTLPVVSKEGAVHSQVFDIGMVLYDHDGNAQTLDDQTRLNGSLAFSHEIAGTLVFDEGLLQSLNLGYEITENLNAAGAVGLAGMNTTAENPFVREAERQLPPVAFEPVVTYVEHVPVVVTPVLNLLVRISCDVASEMTASFNQSFSSSLALAFSGGAWTHEEDLDPQFAYVEPAMQGNARMTVTLYPELTLLFYGREAARIHAEQTGQAETTVMPDYSLTGRLTAQYSAGTDVNLSLIAGGLADHQTALLEENFEIYSWSDNPMLPAPPVLVSPQNGLTVDSATPVLVWQSSDLARSYDLQVDGSSDFASPAVHETALNDTSFECQTDLAAGAYYWRVRGVDGQSRAGSWSAVWQFTVDSAGVTLPQTPAGPAEGLVGQSYAFVTGASVCSDGDAVEYRFDWGDGDLSGWGAESRSHAYGAAGSYAVSAQARCTADTALVSGWSGQWLIDISEAAHVVSVPDVPQGPAEGFTHESLNFVTGSSLCDQGDAVAYRFDWGDSTWSDWGGENGSHAYGAAGTYTIRAQARCVVDTQSVSEWSAGFVTQIALLHSVDPPSAVTGPFSGNEGDLLTYTASSGDTCSHAHPLEYRFDWRDGSGYSSWGSAVRGHQFWFAGTYQVRAQVRCTVDRDLQSDWTNGPVVTIQPVPTRTISGVCFVRHVDTTYDFISGVTIETNDGRTAVTDGYGYYELVVPTGWSGTFSAAKTGYVFVNSANPAQSTRSVSNISTDLGAQDFAVYE